MRIETRIHIDAPPKTVWAVLTDFQAYPEWNPFIQSASGIIAEGERLQVRIVPPGKKGMAFNPRVTRVNDEREFRWLGHLGVRGIFDGEHSFEIVPRNVGCDFIHCEEFRGFLAPVLLRVIGESTRRGFDMMNQALKQRCEAIVGRVNSAQQVSDFDRIASE